MRKRILWFLRINCSPQFRRCDWPLTHLSTDTGLFWYPQEVPLLTGNPITIGSLKTTQGAIQTNEFNMVTSTRTAHETNYDESRNHHTTQSVIDGDTPFGTSSDPFDLRYGSASFSRHTMRRQSQSQMHASDMYEEIALPDFFLDDYYSQVLTIVVHTIELF